MLSGKGLDIMMFGNTITPKERYIHITLKERYIGDVLRREETSKTRERFLCTVMWT
jgi:hypothetical protein